MGTPEGEAPSIILLPELSIGPGDVRTLRTLITAARPNTLLICGVGHMTATQVDAIEQSAPLCGEPVEGHYANCAIIGCSGTDKFFLQPKVVASREELDCHWPGKVVRYFMGEYFSFVVLVCSEMLNRAQARTTIHDVLDIIARDNRQEPVVFWLQHNPKPRSAEFSQSLEELAHFERPSVFVVGSRKACPPRLKNFAVSGALFKKSVLPKHFNVLTRQFHYVEPIAGLEALSRVVLLRYDVDVNLVSTTLGSAIEANDRTSRSQLFGSVSPMVMQNGVLADSLVNTHLVEIVRRAQALAAESDHDLAARIQTLTDTLVALGTAKFQDFLDRGIVPRPHDEDLRHAPGQQHSGGDYFCDCWKHRECIDFLCDDNEAAKPVAYLLLALAKIFDQGLVVSFTPTSNSLANVRLSGPLGEFDLCIVYPFTFDAEGTELAVRGGTRPRLAEPGYIVLGTSGRAGRPALAHVSQAVARPTGSLRAASATDPMLKAIYYDELAHSMAAGTLAQLLQQKFG